MKIEDVRSLMNERDQLLEQLVQIDPVVCDGEPAPSPPQLRIAVDEGGQRNHGPSYRVSPELSAELRRVIIDHWWKRVGEIEESLKATGIEL